MFSSSEDQILAENIPVPFSPVPIATIEVQSQGPIRSPSLSHQAAVTPVKKTKFQEDQEDAYKPAWVLSGSPWVTFAFAIVQIREIMSVMKKQPPTESESLQVKLVKVDFMYADAENAGLSAATLSVVKSTCNHFNHQY